METIKKNTKKGEELRRVSDSSFLNCNIELYPFCCGGLTAMSTYRFSAVTWLWWMWSVREFPSSLTIHNETNLFGQILPSDTVIQIFDWLAIRVGRLTALYYSALLCTFILLWLHQASRRTLFQKKNQINMKLLLCLAALAAIYCTVDSKRCKYYFRSTLEFYSIIPLNTLYFK